MNWLSNFKNRWKTPITPQFHPFVYPGKGKETTDHQGTERTTDFASEQLEAVAG